MPPTALVRSFEASNLNSLRWHTWSAYARDSWQVKSKANSESRPALGAYPLSPTTDHGGVKLFNPDTGNVLIGGGNGNAPIDLGVDVGWGQNRSTLRSRLSLG